jgi:hypothetical protein
MPKESELLAKLAQARTLIDRCIGDLEGMTPQKSKRGRVPERRVVQSVPIKVDFDANERNFMKDHAKGLGGGKKFVLVLAYLAKGDTNREVRLKDIETTWSRMTTMLGDFNRKYSSDAKELGLVNTKKQGIYVLRPRWKEILS